jgi:hypothetical protein
LERGFGPGAGTALEQLVMFAGAGCRDGMAVLVVGVAGRGGRFVGNGTADHRLGRGVVRRGLCGDHEAGGDKQGEKRGGKKACESHERPLGGM